MRVRPYNNERFEVDIGCGDIAKESGDILIIGRPRGVIIDGRPLGEESFEKFKCPNVRPERQILRCNHPELPWSEVYSFHYRARHRQTPPQSESDYFFHYWHLTHDLSCLFSYLDLQQKLDGDSVIGIVPFSWRAPAIVSHAIAESLEGLFSSLHRPQRSNRRLKVIIRSLSEPVELYEVFDLDYYYRFLNKRGFSYGRWKVWYPISDS